MKIYKYPYKPHSCAGFLIKFKCKDEFWYVHQVYRSIGGVKNVASKLHEFAYYDNKKMCKCGADCIFVYRLSETDKEMCYIWSKGIETMSNLDRMISNCPQMADYFIEMGGLYEYK